MTGTDPRKALWPAALCAAQQAEHMAAPTNAANVKKVLANPEPSTQCAAALQMSAFGGKADMPFCTANVR
jgi:hypothetical protein